MNNYEVIGFLFLTKNSKSSKGLDLILHTPGGSVAATESIVSYLKMIFGDDIRAIVPQMAMSAGTMIACSCKSVVMGKQSSLGPIDPQFGIVSAHAIKEELERIINEVKTDPSKIIVWREILQKYNPTLIGECEKAIKWSKEMVRGWLESNMLKHDKVKANKVVDFLSSHEDTYTHDRHLDFNTLSGLGLIIEKLEENQVLQDKVLSVHHSTIISMSQTQATKIIENNMGKAYIQSV